MSKKNAVSFVRSEPAFIQQFKEKVGYKEDPDINAKKAEMPDFDADDQSDKEDEKPVVVVLKKGDLSAEEAERLQQKIDQNEEEKAIEDGKITFKKPEKRSSTDPIGDLNASTKKKKDSSKSVKSNCKKVNDKKLLSFGDEEEDDT